MDEDNVTDSLQRVEADAGANSSSEQNVPLGTQPTLVPFLDKHNFTALPQWKFEDMYRLDPQFKPSVSAVDNNNTFVNILLMGDITDITLLINKRLLNQPNNGVLV